MSNLINELRVVEHEMTDEQQVQAVIRSLPSNWEHIRVNLTHNDNIKIFDDVARHVELEEDRLLAEKPINKAFIYETKMQGSYGSKHKKGKCKSHKYGKWGIEVNSNMNASMENMAVKKTRIWIVLIVVNLVTLLAIALSQKLRSNRPYNKGSNNLCGISLNFKEK